MADGSLEFGGMPITTYKGKAMQQMIAVLRSFGMKHGYYNVKDAMECYRADFIIECYCDSQFGVLAKAAFNPDFKDPEKQGDILKDATAKGFDALFGQIEQQLEKNGTKFVASDKVTIADVVIAAFYFTNINNPMNPFQASFNTALENYPKSKAYLQHVDKEFKACNAKYKAVPF